MNRRSSVIREFAERLAAHAEKTFPQSRADWAKAMRGEIHHIPDNRAALMWAVGCVFASYTERMRNMISNHPRVSRSVLALEMLCCFTPLTLLCLATIENLGRMGGRTGALALTVAAAGPIGLLVAFKIVVLNRPLLTQPVFAALCVLAVWAGLPYTLQTLAAGEILDHWRDLVLIALLPVLGLTHLLYLAERPVSQVAAA